jgi:hypothetical protein
MAPHTWARRLLVAGYSPYAAWARHSVDALWWLADLDESAFAASRAKLGSHNPDIVDIAHARWATATAKTAIDLCAADIAVGHQVKPFWAEKRDQTPGEIREQFAWQPPPESLLGKPHRTRLSPPVERWLTDLVDDAGYVGVPPLSWTPER